MIALIAYSNFAAACLGPIDLHSASRPANLMPLKAEITLPNGTISVYLPRHIAPGDHISGSVFASPAGNDWDTQHQNQVALEGYDFSIGGKTMKVGAAMFEMDVPKDASEIDMSVSDESSVRANVRAMLSAAALGVEGAPSIVQQGFPLGAVGSFNGSRENTSAFLNDRPAGILAEGSSECYVTSPSDRTGTIDFAIKGDSESFDQKVNVVDFTFMAPASPTVRGHKIAIGVELDGLQGLAPSSFPVIIELHTDNPSILSFDGRKGDTFRMDIWPADVQGGHALKTVPIKTRGKGTYNVTGTVYASR